MKTTGTKHDQEKPRLDLLPWAELEEVVRVLTFGAAKYSPDNWKSVQDGRSRYLAAALRHIAQVGLNQPLDAETGLSHYAHAICSLLFAHWHEKNGGAKP